MEQNSEQIGWPPGTDPLASGAAQRGRDTVASGVVVDMGRVAAYGLRVPAQAILPDRGRFRRGGLNCLPCVTASENDSSSAGHGLPPNSPLNAAKKCAR